MSLKAAIIGLGRIAWGFDKDPKRTGVNTHAKAYTTHAQTRLVAACDSNPEAIKEFLQFYPDVKVYSDATEMMRAERPDIVSVCTPTHLHAPVVNGIAALGPKVILCEKPIAHTLDDAAMMAAECLRHDVELMVNHTRRFDGMHQQIATALQNGLIGRITGGNIYYTAGVYNTGSHIIDVLRMILGHVTHAQAYAESSIEGKDPTIGGRLIFGGKVNIFVHAIDVRDYLMFELDIYGTEGRIHIYNSGFDCDLYLAREHRTFSGYKALQKVENPFLPGLQNMMMAVINNCVDVVLNNGQPASPAIEAIHSLAAITALRQSYENEGEVVKLPRERPDVISSVRAYVEEVSP